MSFDINERGEGHTPTVDFITHYTERAGKIEFCMHNNGHNTNEFCTSYAFISMVLPNHPNKNPH